MFIRSAVALIFVISLALPGYAQTAASATSPAPAKRTCNVISLSPTAGETLIAAKKYKEAESWFRDVLAKDAASIEAHFGLVRALVGEDKIAESRTEADLMLKQNPRNALAEVAESEAAYRAADLDAAVAHARAALQDDSCEGRAASAMADIFGLNAYYAQAARLYVQGHKLRPNDELLRRDWIDSLPRKERQAEMEKYLAAGPALSSDDQNGYNNELEHLKSRRPGECRAVTRPESTTTPLQPVFGNSSHPTSYGLDVLFNGKRRRMQIDTGASGITLTQGAARSLGLTAEFHGKTSGVGEEKSASYLTHVQSIKIGGVEFADCMVDVMEKSKLDVDGLIGMNVFGEWLVTLDYPGAELRLAPLPRRPGSPTTPALNSDTQSGAIDDENDVPHDRYIAPEMKDWERVLRIGHNILLPAGLNKDMTHFVIMDTGAAQSVFAIPFAREAGKLESSPVEFTGVSAKVAKVYTVSHVPLYAANLAIPPADYFSFDIANISHDIGFETSGFLGLTTLQRLTITIDYRDNLLKLFYDPKHDVHRF